MQSQMSVTSNGQLLGIGVFYLPDQITGVVLQPRKANIYLFTDLFTKVRL